MIVENIKCVIEMYRSGDIIWRLRIMNNIWETGLMNGAQCVATRSQLYHLGLIHSRPRKLFNVL